MQNQCAEIKIRAERRAGEILGTQEKHKGAATPFLDRRASSIPKLNELGINYHQSHNWQEMAEIPSRQGLKEKKLAVKNRFV